jgi:hypothetical protein
MPGIEDFNKKFEQIADKSSGKILDNEMRLYNPNDQLTPYAYNAGSKGDSYFKRYYAYGPETFERIGFSPFKSNEKIFNEGTGTAAEFQRSIVHGFAPLFARGFASGPNSLARMMKGDFSDDPEEAAAYAEASAIASSTKGGLTGFGTNLLTNFGYTAGIMLEAVAEEALTLGLSSEYTIFNAGKNLTRGIKYVGRAPKVGKGILATESILQRTNQLGSTLKKLDNITDARNYWQSLKVDRSIGNVARNAEKVGKTTGGKVLDFFNPLSNTTEAIIDIAKNSKNLTGLEKASAATFKTVGGLYRDVRNVNMALSEARLEAGFVRKDTFDQLYDEYRETHGGQDPPEEIQDEMRRKAKEASEGALLANGILIYASNKVAFDNIMSPKKGLNRILNKKITDVKKNMAGRTVREFTKKTLKTGKEVLTPKLSTIKRGWKGWKGTVQAIKKQGFQKTAGKVIGYTKANIMEGVQESLQDVISKTSKDYYTEAFYSEPVSSYYYTEAFLNKKNKEDKSFWEHLGEGFQAQVYETNARGEFVLDMEGKKQLSGRGFETFLSGFAMGTLATPLNKALPFIQEQAGRFRNKAKYDAARKKLAEYNEQMAKQVSDSFANDPLNMYNARLYNLGVQSKLADQIADPDTKAKQDAIEEATVKQISQMIELGATDIWLDHLENIKTLTTEEYAEYQGITLEQAEGHTEKIDRIIDKTKNIVKNYDEVKEMYPNPVDLNDYKKGSVEYQKAALFSTAWDEAVRNVIFYNDNYKGTLDRMQKVYRYMTSNELIGKVDPLRVQPLFDENDLDGEIGMLKTEIEALEGSTDPGSKKQLAGRKESLKALEEFRENYNTFMNHFYKTARSQEDDEVQFIESQISDIDAKLKAKPRNAEKVRLTREKQRLETRLQQFEKNEARTQERQELKNKKGRIIELNNKIDELNERKNNISSPEYYDQYTKDTRFREVEIERIERNISDLEKEIEDLNTDVESTMDFTNEKMLANLEGSFKKYMKSLANQSNETLLEGNMDQAFEMLVDYYRLGKEAQKTAEAINILNDPAGFEEHVENNFAWMSDLWSNREDMLRKNILEQTKRIQYNNLLNSLASEGIYVDLEEFANWKLNGELPTEFYDAINKRVVPKGSILYNQAVGQFKLLDYLNNQEEKRKSPEQKLAENLKMLNALEQQEINELQKYNVRKELGVIENKEFTLNSVKDKIGIDQYLEATYINPDGIQEKLIFYKDRDGNIKFNNNQGQIAGNIGAKLTDGKLFAYREEPDPVEVKAIKDKYDQLRAEAAEGSIAATSNVIVEGGIVSIDELTPDTPIANMPEELREQLKAAFEDYRDDPNNEYLFPDNLTNDELENKFVNFIKSEPQALDLINEYIKEQKLKAATTGGTAAAPLITLTNGKKISAENATDKQIQSVLQQYNFEINAIENTKNKSINDEVRLKELQEKYSILEAYVKSRVSKSLTPEMQNALALIDQLQKEQERIEALPTGYKIGQKILRRVTNVIQKFLGKKYEYDKKDVLLAAYNLTIGEGQSVKDFIDVLKASNLPGFNEKSYEAIEKFVNDFRSNRAPASTDATSRNDYNGRISVKRETVKITNSSGDTSELRVTTSLDGSATWEIKNEKGNWSPFDRLKAKNIEELTEIYEKEGDTVELIETEDYTKIQNPKLWDRLSPEQKQRLDSERASKESSTDTKADVEEVTYNELLGKAEENIRNSSISGGTTMGLNFAFFNALTEAIRLKKITSKEQLNNILEEWNERSAYNGNPNKITPNQQKWINEELVKLPETTKAPEDDLEGLRDATINFITEQATYQWGRDRGNVIDDLTKKYFSGEKVQPDLNKISQEAFDSLYGRNGIYQSIQDYIDTGDFIVVANGLIVYDEDANVAGEIDLLLVDREGNFTIVDIKTGEAAKWNGYNNSENKNYAKQIENTYQQMVYARLLKNMFGIDAEIAIIPIETTSDITTGKILTAKRPSAPTLLKKGKTIFPLEPTQEMYDKLNAEIPETAPKFNGTVPSNTVEDIITDPNLDDVENTDYEDENPEGEEGGETNNLKEFNALKSKIEKADFDELQLLMVDLAMNSLKYSAEQIAELNNLIEARKESLKVQDETEEGEIITYNEGDQVYSESDIFTANGRKFLSANQTAVISQISGDRITVKPEGKRTKMEMSVEEFKKKFKPAATLFSGEETDGPVVDESEGVTQESTDTVSDLLYGKDAASRQQDLEDQAKKEDTRDNLLDDLDC